MGFFGKKPKHRSFDYIPRYYDPDKEKLRARLKKYDEEEKGDPEFMKQRIKSGFRARGIIVDSEYRSKRVKKSNLILLTILIVLICLSYIFLTKYLPQIIEVFDNGSTN